MVCDTWYGAGSTNSGIATTANVPNTASARRSHPQVVWSRGPETVKPVRHAADQRAQQIREHDSQQRHGLRLEQLPLSIQVHRHADERRYDDEADRVPRQKQRVPLLLDHVVLLHPLDHVVRQRDDSPRGKIVGQRDQQRLLPQDVGVLPLHEIRDDNCHHSQRQQRPHTPLRQAKGGQVRGEPE